MMQKHLLVPARVRQIPRQFSWIDQRLVRDQYIQQCDAYALALYLFLATVADAQGLSYYANRSIEHLLSFTPQRLTMAQEALVQAGLIAYQAPLTQVLALDGAAPAVPCTPSTSSTQMPDLTGKLRSLRALLDSTTEDGS